MVLTLISWNTKGLLERMKNGELTSLLRHNPEIVCFQETGFCLPDTVEKLNLPHGYSAWFSPKVSQGSCGVGMIARIHPASVSFASPEVGKEGEGRLMTAEFRDFSLINTYIPPGDEKHTAMQEKLSFLDHVLDTVGVLRNKGRPVIVGGDLSVAHTDLDLWNFGNHYPLHCGTTPEERSRLDQLIRMGFSDTFRLFSSQPGAYTWRQKGNGLRHRERGLRLDYFFASADLKDRVLGSSILHGTHGSSHSPIILELEIPEQES